MLVGITMALTIIVCLFAFIWIYATIGPMLSDFIPSNPAATATPSVQPSASGSAAPAGSGGESTAPASESKPSASKTSDAAEWQPTHKIADGDDINFRADATTDSNSVAVLAPGTPLKSLGEEQQAEGVTWMHFQTENGTEGWVRTLDVVQSNA